MVMNKGAMRKNLRQSIIKSLGRYIAIVLIIALGDALFLGLLMTRTDMVQTGQTYLQREHMFDFQLISTYGWTDEQVEKAAQLEGVDRAEGIIYQDVIARRNGETDDSVFRFYNIPEQVNQVMLRGGRMPEKPWECLADGYFSDDSVLGMEIQIAASNDEDTLDAMVYDTYTVVGYAASPLYMDNSRGTTRVGTGTIACFFYIPREGFSAEYYSQIDLTLTRKLPIYSEEYNDYLESFQDILEPEAERLGQERFDAIKLEAEEEYQEGYQEYQDGLQEYRDGEAEFYQELEDARKELEDAEETIRDTAADLQSAELQLETAKKQIQSGRTQLNQQEELLKQQEQEARSGLEQANAGVATLEALIADARNQMKPLTPEALPGMIEGLNAQIALIESGTASEELAAQYDVLCGQREKLTAALAGYNTLTGKLAEAKTSCDVLQYALDVQIPAGYQAISDGRAQLDEAWSQLSAQFTKLYDGKNKLKDAREEVAQGWIDYEEGKLEGEQELADAWEELEEGRLELQDAREEIDSLEPVEVFLLDRNTNMGYNTLDSSSSIVAGISRVLPVFFLAVASLVCITTMTRMIDEERTQIGTLKALGYSNAAIMSKYLIYSGSAAVIGCILGSAVGSSLFPLILWKVYGILLYLQPDVVLTVDWPLCITVLVVYTGLMLFVSWYSCRRTLREVPAELIRPKAPDAGKKILLEYLPFWNRIRFLNKVMLRNIFRYRQRLAMMLLGIGGCTALLVTGFGLRDSLVGIVDYQFTNITPYDLEVYFDEHQTPEAQQIFIEKLSDQTEDVLFFHRSPVDLEFDSRAKELYMIGAGEELERFVHMRRHAETVPIPGVDEAVLSIGISQSMGISVGDTVTVRDADMQTMTLTVSGIYENHLHNYCIVNPETIRQQLGEPAEQQVAFIRVGEGIDAYSLGAQIAEMDDVLNVSVSEDLASMITHMLEALDLVVVVIVVCAGLLAAIVLYNLTNININERIREIATIKVLGFNASETAAYVFKENLALTVAGSILGLFLGKLLLEFVILQIRIDIVWFRTLIQPPSYWWALLLTMVSAMVVNFVFYFKLDKINMAEALKSVE